MLYFFNFVVSSCVNLITLPSLDSIVTFNVKVDFSFGAHTVFSVLLNGVVTQKRINTITATDMPITRFLLLFLFASGSSLTLSCKSSSSSSSSLKD